MKCFYLAIAVLIIGSVYFWYSSQDSFVLAPGAEVEQSDSEGVADMKTAEGDSVGMEDTNGVSVKVTSVDSISKVFAVKGVNFAYDVSTITVNEGDTVTINFESSDGFHDWVVDEFSATTEKVKPGVSTSVTFVADKAGTYEYYCSVGSHRAEGMVGKLVVNAI